MGFDVTNDDVDALGMLTASRLEHGVRLADACRVAEEDAEFAPSRALLLVLHAR
jgi:hypothetical protein